MRREDPLAAAAYFLADPAAPPELLHLVTVSNEMKPYQWRETLEHAKVP